MAFNSNIEILQRFQNKILRIIVNASWYVTNNILYPDLNVPYVRDEIKRYSQKYADRMKEHPNILMKNEKRQDYIQTKKKASTRSMHLTGAIL